MKTKTNKISITYTILGFVLFLSVSSVAGNKFLPTGDNEKSGSNRQLTKVETAISGIESATKVEIEYLQFDVNNYIETPGEISEMPVNEFEYLRFDVKNFSATVSSEINELPL